MKLRPVVWNLIYWSQLWRLFKWFNRGKIKILMYHGVTNEDVMNWTQITIDMFDQHMGYLTRAYTPVSLADALDMLAGKRPVVPGAVVVTFDDGFKNNVTTAYPILQKYGIPGTVFVTTSFIDCNGQFGGMIWTDYVYAILDATHCLAVNLEDVGLGQYDLGTPERRSDAKATICQHLKQLDYREKNRLIDVIRSRVGSRIRKETEEIFSPMTWDDIRRLDREQLVGFGAHTVHHEILSKLPETVMVEEIVGSQAKLEQQLGTPVRHFAYPNGTSDDFTEQATHVVRQNFSCALTTITGQNPPGSDLYQLRRISVGRDTTFAHFKLSLSGTTDFIYSLKRAFAPSQAGY